VGGLAVAGGSDLRAISQFLLPPSSPGANFTTGGVVQQVQQLNQLVTTKYTIQTVVGRGNEGGIFGIGKDKILLVAQGRVIAGLDLSQLKESDVQVASDGSSVTVKLPPARIFDYYLIEQNTFVYDRDTGIWPPADPNLETEARRAALDEILSSACEAGVMQEANDNAVRAIEQLLRALEFQRVTVIPSSNSKCEAPA